MYRKHVLRNFENYIHIEGGWNERSYAIPICEEEERGQAGFQYINYVKMTLAKTNRLALKLWEDFWRLAI